MPRASRLSESEKEDSLLAIDARNGSQSAFNRLMDKHYPAVMRYLSGHVQDIDQAYDIAQDTFVAVFRNLDRYDPQRPLLAWVFVIARNKARDHHRRRKALRWVGLDGERDDFVSDAPNPEEIASSASNLERAQGLLEALPEGLRTQLLLSVTDDLSLVQIGDIMRLSAKAVEVRIYRARKFLKEQYSE